MFCGQRTCTLNMKEHLPNDYNNITQDTIAAMLHNKELLSETDTIQISSCHRYASICFTNRDISGKFCESEHQILPDKYIYFEPDYYKRHRISIENIPIKLPDRELKTFLSEYVTIIGKTYYPRTRYNNKHFTTGTRVYQSIQILKHLPRHIHQFGRYYCICYDLQPNINLAPPNANLPHTEETPVSENHTTLIIQNANNYPDHTPETENRTAPQIQKSKIPVPIL